MPIPKYSSVVLRKTRAQLTREFYALQNRIMHAERRVFGKTFEHEAGTRILPPPPPLEVSLEKEISNINEKLDLIMKHLGIQIKPNTGKFKIKKIAKEKKS